MRVSSFVEFTYSARPMPITFQLPDQGWRQSIGVCGGRARVEVGITNQQGSKYPFIFAQSDLLIQFANPDSEIETIGS